MTTKIDLLFVVALLTLPAYLSSSVCASPSAASTGFSPAITTATAFSLYTSTITELSTPPPIASISSPAIATTAFILPPSSALRLEDAFAIDACSLYTSTTSPPETSTVKAPISGDSPPIATLSVDANPNELSLSSSSDASEAAVTTPLPPVSSGAPPPNSPWVGALEWIGPLLIAIWLTCVLRERELDLGTQQLIPQSPPQSQRMRSTREFPKLQIKRDDKDKGKGI